ncbi:MAG: response regulator [Bacteroidota bacterium]|jgi:CheY-like chemotaxis protein
MSIEKYNVCLIDDDKVYQFTSKMILEATQLTSRITTFFNGQEAIEFFLDPANQQIDILPDVIFLDINMPIMNGWNFLEEFDKIFYTLPKKILIYVVSSSVDDSDMEKSKSFVSVADYVIKPINKEKYRLLLSVQR